jgi:hypothetical protein
MGSEDGVLLTLDKIAYFPRSDYMCEIFRLFWTNEHIYLDRWLVDLF